ncbi:Histidine biosynthesis bifunctional protein hisIE, chloroplastic, partial [Tetrabaena socialis]
VQGLYLDCDRDSIVYLSDPIGPSCHTGARSCWFTQVQLQPEAVGEGEGAGVASGGAHDQAAHVPRTTLLALERTIALRREALAQPTEGKPSWTARLLTNPELLCKKIREEAGELCQTLEAGEGRERAASEMADLMYHAMVLLNLQ